MRAAGVVVMAAVLGGCVSADPSGDMGLASRGASERGVDGVELLSEGALEARVGELLADGLTADEAGRIGVLNNRRARAAYESIGVARADLVRAGLLTNPVFDFSIRFVEAGGGEVIDMGLSQRLTELLTMGTRRAVAETELEGARAGAVGAAIGAAFAARRGVVELQAARAQLALVEEAVEAQRLAYEYIRALHEAGNVADVELTRRRLRYEESRLELARAEMEVVEAGERLNVAMGVWGARTAWRLAEELPAAPGDVAGVPDDFERRAVASSLRVEAARVRLQVAARRAGAAGAAAVLDDVEAGVVAERNEAREWEVGPSFSVPLPIFDTGAAGRAGAEAAMRRERELYADEAIRVRAAARVAAARMEGAGAEERHRREVLLPLAERELAETVLRYNAMQAGAPELLEARGRVAMARAAHVGALGRLWGAALRVEELGAGGSPEESGGTGTGAVSGWRTGGADAAGGH